MTTMIKTNALLVTIMAMMTTMLALMNIGSVNGQPLITYRDEPNLVWEGRISPVRKGNGVFLSQEKEHQPPILVSTSKDGSVSAFHPGSGTNLWSYGPPKLTRDDATKNGGGGGVIGTVVSSSSGMTFVTPTSEDNSHVVNYNYMVYSIMENENSVQPTTRVVALDMNGQELWMSTPLEGVSSGTPVASEDGSFVFLTHNSDFERVGHFTILDSRNNGAVFFTQTNETNPFAPLGIKHSPTPEGYYQGGEKNRNDMLVWSLKPKFDDQTVGGGATFAFQFPIGFDFTNVDASATNVTSSEAQLGYTLLGSDIRDFQSIVKPVFANGGLSMYWGTTRSQFRCWIGQEGLKRFRFNLPRTATVGFTRGSPPSQSVFAPLALSTHSDSEPYIFGGTASTEFVKLNYDFSEQVVVETLTLVQTEARVSPDNLYVYYVEFSGQIHQAMLDDLTDRWVQDLRVPVEGEFALSKDGSTLFVADVTGFLYAYAVGDPPSHSPSISPSDIPSDSPSLGPTTGPAFPIDVPTMQPVRAIPAPTLATTPPSFAPLNVSKQTSGSATMSSSMVVTLQVIAAVTSLFSLI